MTRPLNPPGETPGVGVPPRLAAHMTVAEQHDWLRGFLAARPVSRRSALRGAAGIGLAGGLASVLAACGSPTSGGGTGGATPLGVTGRHLSFGTDPTSQMAVGAELTAKPAGKVLLDLGIDTQYGTTIEAEVRELVSQVPQADGSIRAADQFFVHGLAEQLRPGQSYHYRFRLPGGGTSQDAVFSTAPTARVPFTFTAFGDQGVNAAPANSSIITKDFTDDYYKQGDDRRTPAPASSLVELIARRHPAFHLLAGDICYADPSGDGEPVKNAAPAKEEKGFDNFDPHTWTAYFASIEASAATTPWMFATGNHDMEALYDDNKAPGGATHGYGGHAARLDLPRNGPSKCPSVYTFKYSNVGVISVDANDLSTEIATNAGYSGGAQASWVRQTLAALRADPAVDFIVAFFHHCAYATSASHASDGGVRSTLTPMFDEFGVDLVVQGHNHQYERTNPIKGGRTGVQAPDGATVHPETDGTTYICVGSGGRPRYTWQPGETDRYRGNTGPDSGTQVTSFLNVADGGKTPETVDWSQARYLDYAVLSVDVTPGAPGADSTMTVRAIADTGQEIDAVTLVRKASGTAPKPTASGSWTRTPTGLSIPA
ncbi:metallophosphoesterase [Pseudonocardia spinosispora]|uniref:metallophosphoesterase n=1 Tax=Pseudonocardia spinosispora TaxID=103441 RepID=UPI00040CF4F3|nr:metallophosphoesterase [Pseudonocardia spinosispora]